MTIIEALQSPQMFGGLTAFKQLKSWERWLIFLKATYGLPLLNAAEERVFCHHTGRSRYKPPQGGFPEVVCIVGRQSGKSRIATTIACYEAISQRDVDGEVFCVLVSQDSRSAIRTLLSYSKATFQRIPAFQQAGESILTDSVTLTNGCVLAAYPCRPAAIRGLRAANIVLDELAHFRTSEGFPTDLEMIRSARPALSTTGGKLIILSSPYAASGALFDLHRSHYAKDDSQTLVWVASAPQMNPKLSADYLARMEQDDPEAFRSEVLGEFRTGLTTFLDPDSIQACVQSGVREIAPVDKPHYGGFCDASGGRHDRFVVAVSHREHDRAVLSAIRYWTPTPNRPLDPKAVTYEASEFLRKYRLRRVYGDRYAAEFLVSAFRQHGVEYVTLPPAMNKSALYHELLPAINSKGVMLLDNAELLRELRSLERHATSGGTRDRVDHRPGSRDDIANACAGALWLARDVKKGREPYVAMYDG